MFFVLHKLLGHKYYFLCICRPWKKGVRHSPTFPYGGGGLRRVITKGGVGVHFKPLNTLREHLVSPKDKFKKQERRYTVNRPGCNSR